jgi:hypothetical protein
MTRRRITTLLLAFSLVALLLPVSVAASAPDAVDDADTITEDSGADVIAVLANDDTDAGGLVVDGTSSAAHGDTSTNGTTVTYTPNVNYFGPDSFTYDVHNDDGVATATVEITVLADNDDPVATDDAFTIDEDVTTDFNVLANDSDVEGDVLSIAGNPPNGAHGVTTVVGGKVRYNPANNYHGTDTFTYTVSDGHGGTDVGTVDVTIDPENDDPVADDEAVTVGEDSGGTVINVRSGDTDPDGDSLIVSSVTNPPKGTAVVSGGGTTVTYTPDLDQTGSDGFDYTVIDGLGGSDVGHVAITITPDDDAPVAVTDDVTIDEDAFPTVPIDVLANDTDTEGDDLTITGADQGSLGDVAFSATGVTYLPDLNANGSDTFDYRISDGHGGTAEGTVNVTINAVNDDPVGVADAFTASEDTPTDLDVLANDTDVEGDTLSIQGSPSVGVNGGTTSVVGGKVRYTPAPDFDGSDSFTYTVSDGHGGTNTGLATVTITPVNDDPLAADDTPGVPEDITTPQTLNVLANDTDPDGDVLTITAVTPGTKGVVAIKAGSLFLTYKPNANASGTDTFTYTISDGHGGTDMATVVVTIDPLNDPPNAVNDLVSVPEGAGATVVDVLANDSDPDGNTVTILAKTNGSHGTVTITGNGTGLTYNPAGNYVGTDTFKYTLDDSQGGTDQATVKVTVVRDKTDPVMRAPLQRFIGQTVGDTTTKVRVSWGATDAGSGVKSYKLQVSTNGGSYQTISLPKATSTRVDRSLTTGRTYRFRVRATDKEGNVSAYAYGPTIKANRYSQESTKVLYVGSWTKTTSSKVLGHTVRHTSSNTKSATFVFTGRDVGWIATRATTSGKAQLLIDGVLVTTVDLDISKTAYRKLVFQRHFSSVGTHTLEIQPVGDGRIDIDGFAVLQ